MTDMIPAATADTKAQPPAAVKQAILCLWVSLLIGLTRMPLQFSNSQFRENILAQITTAMSRVVGDQDINPATLSAFEVGLYIALGVSCLLSIGITALVLHKLKSGRNWARILCLIYGLFSLIGLFKVTNLTLNSGLTIAFLAVGYYALYLLFTAPAAAWFGKKAAANAADKW
jgi:hypothetical protein